tara:strand:+ start:1293 stop:2006 length:714 start_codon:yes stop_codon:yes gene_type:complete
MSKAPAFQFYAQDFLSGVMDLTMDERGLYITLLARQWTIFDEKGIPKKRLALLVGFEWDNLPEMIKEKFVDNGDYFFNSRLMESFKQLKSYKEKQRINGQKGGRPKTQTIPKKRSSLKIEDRSMKNEDRKKKKEVELEVINKNSPSIDEFIDYGKALLKQLNKNEEEYDFALRSKYHTWNDDGWKNGHGRKIKNWKNTLGNTIPFLKPIYNGTSKKINQPKYSKEFEREILEGLQSD